MSPIFWLFGRWSGKMGFEPQSAARDRPRRRADPEGGGSP
ncbi:unnamed protein product [[Actinomadura] parvosata subsp. kistnae]|nr:unnamed protein product [Actinomadura parvosata subsp. kistnae]